jgi:drug/metabolite transporter (DMT)-like permease
VAAFLNAFNMTILRMLKSFITNDTALQYFYCGQLFYNSLIMVQEGNTIFHSEPLTGKFFGTMVLLVIFGYSAQMLVGRAVFLAPASRVMPFTYVLVIVSFLSDVLMFNQSFNLWAIAVILVVCISLFYLIKNT